MSPPRACITLPKGGVPPRSSGELKPTLSSAEADLSTDSLHRVPSLARRDTRVWVYFPQRSPSTGSFPALTSLPLLLSWDPRPPKPRVLLCVPARPGSIWGILSEPAGYWQMVGETFRKVVRAQVGRPWRTREGARMFPREVRSHGKLRILNYRSACSLGPGQGRQGSPVLSRGTGWGRRAGGRLGWQREEPGFLPGAWVLGGGSKQHF